MALLFCYCIKVLFEFIFKVFSIWFFLCPFYFVDVKFAQHNNSLQQKGKVMRYGRIFRLKEDVVLLEADPVSGFAIDSFFMWFQRFLLYEHWKKRWMIVSGSDWQKSQLYSIFNLNLSMFFFCRIYIVTDFV